MRTARKLQISTIVEVKVLLVWCNVLVYNSNFNSVLLTGQAAKWL